jgi:hypothetical protein
VPAVRTGLKPKLFIGAASGMFALMDKVRQNSGPKPIRLAHCCPNRKKLWRFLKIGGSVSMRVVPPLGPTYMGGKCRSVWAQSEVLTWRTCGGTRCELGEHFGNPLGT